MTKTATNNNTSALSTHDKLAIIQTELNDYYLERKPVVEAILVALIAMQHVLLYGPPGTGKSDLVRALASHITDAQNFEICVSKFTAPEEMFGPLNMPELAAGRYVRNITGYLPTAHVAFVDEIFKSSSACLNTLLPVMAERIYHQEGGSIKCPLMTLIGASNELPESRELSALDDRFIVRFMIDYLSTGNRNKLHRRIQQSYEADQTIDVAELQQLQRLVPQVVFTPHMEKQFDKLLAAAQTDGLAFSDRAMRQAKRMIAARAVLYGRTEAVEDDFDVVEFMMWKDPKDRAKVRQIVAQCANPLKAQSNKMLDDCTEVYNTIAGKLKKTTDAVQLGELNKAVLEANTKMRGAVTELKRMIENAKGDTSGAQRNLDRIQQYNNNLVRFMQGNMDEIIDL